MTATTEHRPECPMLDEQWPKHPLEICEYCDMISACEQRVLREAIAAIEAEQREIPTDTWRRIGLGSAKSAVTKLMREKE